MDQLARNTLHKLRVESLATYPSAYAAAKKSLLAPTGGVFRSQAGLIGGRDTIDYGFDERIRLSEFGALLLGQEHHFKVLAFPSSSLKL